VARGTRAAIDRSHGELRGKWLTTATIGLALVNMLLAFALYYVAITEGWMG
jgi:hypothetical protein